MLVLVMGEILIYWLGIEGLCMTTYALYTQLKNKPQMRLSLFTLLYLYFRRDQL